MPGRRSAAHESDTVVDSAKSLSSAKKPGRGRPSKASIGDDAANKDPQTPVKRGRGRPPKVSNDADPAPATRKRGREAPETSQPPKKRGRPPKEAKDAVPAKVTEAKSSEAPKKRGRPASSKPAVPKKSDGPPKRRGRPPKGGETTKIGADDSAAANQLEDQLKATADEEEEEVKEDENQDGEDGEQEEIAGSLEKEQPEEDEEDVDIERKPTSLVPQDDKASPNEAENHFTPAQSSANYWLMKAEQEDREVSLKSGRIFNVKFTIDDLRARSEPEPWDGVRNAVAAKNMRAMRKGDLAFFYASGGKGSRSPGITGIMEIVAEHSPDTSVHDEDSYGFVEKESERARWCVVHVAFRKKLNKPVLLKDLQQHAVGLDDPLSNMQVLKQSRTSVSYVSKDEWDFIVENLIHGYE